MTLFRRKNRRKRSLSRGLLNGCKAIYSTICNFTKVAAVVALIAAIPLGLYKGYRALIESDYFVVRAIRISGNERLSRADILTLAGLDERRNIFSVDADVVSRRLLNNPWVVDTDVETHLPRTITIWLREREPGGWLYFGDLLQVDTDGVVIESGDPADVEGPIITGIEPVSAELDGGASMALIHTAMEIAHLYQAQGLGQFDELAEVHFDELTGFCLLTARDGMEIRLGNDRFLARLQRLREVFETLQDEQLYGRYVLLDADDELTRVAVGPTRPRMDGHRASHFDAPHNNEVQ